MGGDASLGVIVCSGLGTTERDKRRLPQKMANDSYLVIFVVDCAAGTETWSYMAVTPRVQGPEAQAMTMENLSQVLCNSKSFVTKYGRTMVYNYHNPDNSLWGTFAISPTHCKKWNASKH